MMMNILESRYWLSHKVVLTGISIDVTTVGYLMEKLKNFFLPV